MICALMLGREGSTAFPGKNIYPVLGRPLASYALVTAKQCKEIDRIYLSTDSPKLKEIGLQYGASIIDRPDHLATATSLGEDAFVHGYKTIRDQIAALNQTIEFMVLLFANAPTLSSDLIQEGIRVLRERKDLDSAVSVSRYNMWSPLRARKVDDIGLLKPFVPFETFGDPNQLNCDRDSQGDVWFADMGVSIVRPQCLDQIQDGLLPQRWMGQRIYPLKQWGGLDVDYEWQIPQIEFWLKAHRRS